MVRARVVVLALWALSAGLGFLGAGSLTSRLSTSLGVAGSPSGAAGAILARAFHENADGSFTVVVSDHPLSAGRERTWRREVTHAFGAVPGARIVESQAVAGVWYAVVSTPLDLARASALTSPLRTRLAARGPPGGLLTGPPALQRDLGGVLASDLARGLAVAVLAALVLLALALGIGAALLIPLALALTTIGVALAVVEVLARHLTIALYAPNLIELVGFGLAVDYALVLVARLREEAATRDPTSAVVATMATAGRTVAASGLVVAAGLATLLGEPVGFVRSLGVAGLVVALVAVASAFSLAPAALSLLGPGARRAHPRWSRERIWAGLARRVLARRRLALGGSLLVVVGLASPALGLRLTPLTLSSLPRSMASVRALDRVSARLGPGVATPLVVVIDTHRVGADDARAEARARERLATALSRDREVELAAVGATAPFVAGAGRYAQIDVVARDAFGSLAVQALVGRVRHVLVPDAHFPAGTTVEVGGAPAQGVDFLARVYAAAPLIVLAALVLTSLLVGLYLSSWALALISAGLVLLSQGAALGVTVVVAHLAGGGQVEGWVPIFLFALLLGLSTDYQVFILARVREAHDGGATPDGAVVAGLVGTGRVVSAAALVMTGALVGLAAGRVSGLRELGLGLAAGVLVDVVVVRAVALPSALGLLGERAYPRRMRHIVADPPTPSGTEGGPGPGETAAT